eukprot:jgi/Bigna1/82456/fgenesh1_pg.92_\
MLSGEQRNETSVHFVTYGDIDFSLEAGKDLTNAVIVSLGNTKFQKLGGSGVRCIILELDKDIRKIRDSAGPASLKELNVVEHNKVTSAAATAAAATRKLERRQNCWLLHPFSVKARVRSEKQVRTSVSWINHSISNVASSVEECDCAKTSLIFGWNVDRKRRGGRGKDHLSCKELVFEKDGITIKMCGNAGYWIPKRDHNPNGIMRLRVDSGSRTKTLSDFQIDSNIRITAVKCGYIQDSAYGVGVVLQHSFEIFGENTGVKRNSSIPLQSQHSTQREELRLPRRHQIQNYTAPHPFMIRKTISNKRAWDVELNSSMDKKRRFVSHLGREIVYDAQFPKNMLTYKEEVLMSPDRSFPTAYSSTHINPPNKLRSPKMPLRSTTVVDAYDPLLKLADIFHTQILHSSNYDNSKVCCYDGQRIY